MAADICYTQVGWRCFAWCASPDDIYRWVFLPGAWRTWHPARVFYYFNKFWSIALRTLPRGLALFWSWVSSPEIGACICVLLSLAPQEKPGVWKSCSRPGQLSVGNAIWEAVNGYVWTAAVSPGIKYRWSIQYGNLQTVIFNWMGIWFGRRQGSCWSFWIHLQGQNLLHFLNLNDKCFRWVFLLCWTCASPSICMAFQYCIVQIHPTLHELWRWRSLVNPPFFFFRGSLSVNEFKI